MEIRKDILILVSLLLLYLAFLTINKTQDVAGAENTNLTRNYDDIPPELCRPVYVDRSLILQSGKIIERCVKIGIPDMVFFDKACSELNLSNTTLDLCPEF